jgi:hypothetical protein
MAPAVFDQTVIEIAMMVPVSSWSLSETPTAGFRDRR